MAEVGGSNPPGPTNISALDEGAFFVSAISPSANSPLTLREFLNQDL